MKRMRKLIDLLLAGSLLFLSIEILVRRHLWQQIPTQISAWPVTLLVAVNVVAISCFLFRLKREKKILDGPLN